MTITHHDVEAGMDVLACPGNPHDERGWFAARVLKSMSRGAQVRYLAGPHEGKELCVPFNRVRLAPAPKLAIVPPPKRPLARVEKLPEARVIERSAPSDDVDAQVSAWLDMGRELSAPLEQRRAQLDEEIEWCAREVAAIEEQRAALGAERARVDAQLARIKKLTGAS